MRSKGKGFAIVVNEVYIYSHKTLDILRKWAEKNYGTNVPVGSYIVSLDTGFKFSIIKK
jgi:hypothetical protein